MPFCFFLTAQPASPVSIDADRLESAILALSTAIAGLRKLVLHLPTLLNANDPYLHAELPPACVLQLYFDDLGQLEAALGESSPLAAVTRADRFPILARCTWSQQAMAVRRFDTPEAAAARHPHEQFTYLVEYHGHAKDDDLWLSRYVQQHPPIMVTLPAVREVEVCSRVDYCSALPAARANALQRNKVVFDTAAALAGSLHSPVRHALRKDFESLPPFSGATPHYPMRSVIAAP
jgi:hypothetical protein